MNKLPIVKNKNIVVQEAGKELLIYDLNSNKAYCLNETAAAVFQRCDGKTSLDELKSKTGFTVDLIFLAIGELEREHLLGENEGSADGFKGMSRREAIKRAGLTSMIALPVVTALVAPRAAQALSCTGPGRTLPGNLIQSSGTVFCSPSQSFCDSAATANENGCCSGAAILEPNTTDCGGSDPAFACRCA